MGYFTPKRTNIRIFLFWSLFFLIIPIQPATSVGAFPYAQKITQPDGSTITIRIRGDEWFNWVTTVDGYRILKNRAGIFEYATQLKSGIITGSGITASDPEHRTVSEKQYLSTLSKNIGISQKKMLEKRQKRYDGLLKSAVMTTYFPSQGEASLLLILANFKDTNPSFPSSDFEAFMNQKGYNSTGSFKDYYQEVSGGLLTVNTSVTQWVSVPGNHDYYGPEDKWKEFALHAVQAAADAGVDFSAFDNDGDGIVEGVAIIHQGAGQEVTGDTTDIWSHSYSFSSWGIPESERTFNGVVVNQFTIQPELQYNSGNMNTIGVICHEFGHNLGLPDFYDVDDELNGQYTGTGDWDIMASGTYNGSPTGSSPAHHNPFSKAELGWVTVTPIDEPASITLNPIYSSKEVLRVNSPTDGEYLLLENRRRVGFDSFIPGNGLLVYHVDENLIDQRRLTNTINVDSHQGFYPLAANDTINDASCPFPGTKKVTELTDTGTPATKTWDGQGFNRSMTNIVLTDTVITFDFMFLQDGTPLEFEANPINHESITLSWTPSTDHKPVLIAWSDDGNFGIPENGKEYEAGETISGGGTVLYYGTADTTYNHTGLSSSTQYYYSAWSNKGTSYSQNLKDSAITSPPPITSFPWSDGFENDLDAWMQEYVSGQISWSVNKFYINEIRVKPWAGSFYATFFANTFIPQTTRLVSPILELKIDETYFLRFRHMQHEWEGDQDELRILIKKESGNQWEEIAYFGIHTPEWTERIVEIPYSEPLKIAFEGTSNYGYGIGLDSVEVFEASACSIKPDISASEFSAGNVTKTSMDLTWKRGNGDALLILARKGAMVTEIPENGTSYAANSEFGMGTSLPNETYVIYNGTGTSMTLTGLEHTSEYYLSFFEYYDAYKCYEISAPSVSFETVPNIYNISVVVSDNEGNPIENATLVHAEDTLYTDATGTATFQATHSEDNYEHFDVFKETYVAFSDRFIPDQSKTLQAALRRFEPLSPSHLLGTKENKTISLEWSPVINENFEQYLTYSTEIDGWKFLDKDGDDTYGIRTLTWPGENDPMAFMVFDVHDNNVLQMDYNISAWSGRKVLIAFAAQKVQSNDWLISPPTIINKGDSLSIMARTLDAGSWGYEVINIKVRPEGETEWTTLTENEEVPETWTQYKFALDEEYLGQKVEIAVQSIGNNTFALLIDDIRIGSILESVDQNLTSSLAMSPQANNALRTTDETRRIKLSRDGNRAISYKAPSPYTGNVEYAIYKDGIEKERIYGFSSITFKEEVPDCKEYEYKVSAVYSDVKMESAPTEPVWIAPCYSVLFIIRNADNQPIDNAEVTFNRETQITDINGEAYFSLVDDSDDQEYTISAAGYQQFQNVITIEADTTIKVVMDTLDTGIKKPTTDPISITPNPVDAEATIHNLTDNQYIIEIYEITGKPIKTITINGGLTSTINLSSLKPGMYFLMIRNDRGETHRLKIIKRTRL
ncbi:M6 family metalloprotease domain-containing protein [Thermophagus sp. OGC60D27]|uniref:M6 family metalloprotease domain-containing protein n=1 Tax=Thermophagus sp. OGC60D27 TaxID=3458415 RepID=UPI004037C696